MIKRLIDIAISGSLLLLLAPLACLIALLIRLETPGPFLTARVCAGKAGKPFRLYHFRTMTVARPAAPPRRTPLGRVLCNYTLNDYPTLWSVLTGDMSLVGPRPERLDQIDPTSRPWQQVLRVKPGLIAPAILLLQERYNQTDRPIRTAIDAAYVDHQSVRYDLTLLARGLWLTLRKGHLKGKI